jgi:hypothetical protein
MGLRPTRRRINSLNEGGEFVRIISISSHSLPICTDSIPFPREPTPRWTRHRLPAGSHAYLFQPPFHSNMLLIWFFSVVMRFLDGTFSGCSRSRSVSGTSYLHFYHHSFPSLLADLMLSIGSLLRASPHPTNINCALRGRIVYRSPATMQAEHGPQSPHLRRPKLPIPSNFPDYPSTQYILGYLRVEH